MFRSVSFEVTGTQQIVCEGCEQRVERLLKALPGVGKVRALARKQRIEVLFDTSVLEPPAIVERLREAGYEARVSNATSHSGG